MILKMYFEHIPEYYVGDPSITIKCRPREKDSLMYELRRLFNSSDYVWAVEEANDEK